MICVSMTTPGMEATLAAMAQAKGLADLIELRLDFIGEYNLEQLLAAKPCPVIVANRPDREGGRFRGEESQRIAALQEAIDRGADYVDVELDAAHRIRPGGRTRLIVSYHHFRRTPEHLHGILQQLRRLGADIPKIVTSAKSLEDNLRIFEMLQKNPGPMIAFCMGELGLISRILAPKFGSFCTFASIGPGQESAVGQIPAEEMRRRFRYDRIGPNTKIYGVIANPVAHSLSPDIHNAAFDATGYDGIYVPLKVSRPVEFLRAFRQIDVQGYSVTIPHKEACLAGVDECDEIVQSIGALNTIVNRNGRLVGYNTDWMAAVQSLEEAVARSKWKQRRLEGRGALMIGAGGAGRALAFGLARKGIRVSVTDLVPDKAARLAADVEATCVPPEAVRYDAYDILINASPVGMHPKVEATPIPKEALQAHQVVFDIVYTPRQTRLLREAAEVGCLTVSGFDMFVNQAAAQFELWTGLKAPVGVMAEVIERKLEGG